MRTGPPKPTSTRGTNSAVGSNGDRRPAAGSPLQESLPADHYLLQTMFERERERIFYSEWFCVGREEDLAGSGDYRIHDVAARVSSSFAPRQVT